MNIPVSKNGQLRNYWNTNYSSPLRRVYSPGALLFTAASGTQSSPNDGSGIPSPVYNSSNSSQVGDPRSSSGSYYNVGASSGGGLAELLGASLGGINVGGNQYVGSDSKSLLIPIAAVALLLYFLLKK